MVDFEYLILFHGHLGPYLVLGYKAGECAMEIIKGRKYFGIEAIIESPDLPPPRCFIDGIQLSTGASFGKANIKHKSSNEIRAFVRNRETGKSIEITLTENIKNQCGIVTEEEQEEFARKIASMSYQDLFVFSS